MRFARHAPTPTYSKFQLLSPLPFLCVLASLREVFPPSLTLRGEHDDEDENDSQISRAYLF